MFGIFFLFGICFIAGDGEDFGERGAGMRLKTPKIAETRAACRGFSLRLLPRPSGCGGFLCVRNILFCTAFVPSRRIGDFGTRKTEKRRKTSKTTKTRARGVTISPVCFRCQVGAAVSLVFGIFFLFGICVFVGEGGGGRGGGFRETGNWESR